MQRVITAVAGYGYYMALWNRALRTPEIMALTGNPWQLYAPEQRTVGFQAGAAPAVFGTLGDFDPDLTVQAWF